MSQRCVIGVDGGTEGLRAGIFDLSGRALAFASTPYPTAFPRPGWAEQNPADWWWALGESVRRAMQEARIAAADVIALAVDTTCCSVVALDARGEPLRPSLIWMDVRSQAQAQAVGATADAALCLNSGGRGPVSAEWMIPKALWLKENEAATYDAARIVCEYQDYLNLRLTGRSVASLNNVSVRWHYRARDGGWPSGLCARAGIQDLQQKWPGQVLAPGEVIGPLTADAAAHLGLCGDARVVQGGSDASMAMIGLGVVEAGAMALITGSSHLQLGLSKQPLHGSGIWGSYADAVVPGLHMVEGGQTSTGSVVSWFRRLLGEGVSYAQLDREAATVAIGSEGLLVQEHFQGNRTPHTDPLSRGAIAGLTLRHERGHIFRAIMESVAFGTRLILENQRKHGFDARELTVSGGVTKSDLWLQIHADVTGLPLRLTRTGEAACLGSAMLAAVGAREFASIQEAAGAMAKVTRVVEPDMAAHARYAEPYGRYCALYPALRAVV